MIRREKMVSGQWLPSPCCREEQMEHIYYFQNLLAPQELPEKSSKNE
jgi:hypothetical protein